MSSPDRPSIFRKASLERLSSPERLDQLMTVVSLRDWVPLALLGACTAALFVWGLAGRVPINVTGRGAFVDQGVAQGAKAEIMSLEAPGAGSLAHLAVRRGERVRAGQLLGQVAQPELEAKLRSERAQLADLLARSGAVAPVEGEKAALEARSLEGRRRGLRQDLQGVEALGPLLKSKQLAALRQQRQALEERQREAGPLLAALAQTLASRKELRDQGLIADTVYLSAQRDLLQGREEVAQRRTRIAELAAREAEVEQQYVANEAKAAALRAQLQEVDARLQALRLEGLQSRGGREGAIAESRRRVAELEAVMREQSEIRASVDGTVLEVTGIVGQVVNRGTRIASIQSGGDGAHGLAVVAYFTIGEGKRLRPGLRVQVTPDTVKREEFGGLIGHVTRVAEYPISLAGAMNVVNNESVAQALTADGRSIEAFISLLRDPATQDGYRWSGSRGPGVPLTTGTTNFVRVTLEERAPITFLLPILRQASGLR